MPQGSQRNPEPKATFALAGDDPKPFLLHFETAVVNLEELETVSRGNGALNSIPDRDQVVRRIPLVLRLGETIYPSLSAEALQEFLGERIAKHKVPRYVWILDEKLPQNANGKFLKRELKERLIPTL